MTAYSMQKCLYLTICLLFLAACTGLGGEPEIRATFPPPQLAAAAQPTAENTTPDVGYPQSPPDLINGAQIYAQNCTSCHGVDGRGDGELVLTGQVEDPGNFRDPTSAQEQTPRDWFDTITHGNLEKLMPPWKDALTEQQRWDVSLYTYTLHYTQEQLELGEILYTDCAECHGEQGRGDGPEAAEIERAVGDLSSPQAMVTLSDQSMYVMVVEGQGFVMPAYGDRFNEEERRAVVAYSRSLSLANVEQFTGGTVAQAATPIPTSTLDGSGLATALPPSQSESAEPDAVSRVVDISGSVSNQTAGGSVPAGVTVILRVFDDTGAVEDLTLETTLNPDNTYRFEDVTVEASRFYLTAVEYQGRNFASGLFPGTQEVFDLPISIYELTDDPAVISINAAVTELKVVGDTIEAAYVVQVVNTSDRLFTSTEAEPDGRFKSVSLTLPPGSLVVGVPDQPRYIIAEDQMTVWDTQPMQPGEERFLSVTYLLQYSDGAVIEYPMPFAVKGPIRVLVQPETITLTGEQFPRGGTETLNDEAYQVYGGSLTLPADSLIRYTLSGQTGESAAFLQTPGVVSSDNLPLVLAGVGTGVVALIGGVYILSRRGRGGTGSGMSKQRLIDGLVRQIAELDAQHDAGQINHDLYRNRREQLKTRLAELMDKAE